MEEKKQKRYSDSNFNILYIIVVLLIFVYFSIWFIAKNRMKEILSNKTAKYNMEYEKLSVIVLPFSIRTSIKNLVLSSGLEGKLSTSITFKKIIAKNIIFNKHVHIDVDGDILFNVNDRNSKITLEDDDISFVLGKNNKIKDVNFVANSIYIEESIDNSEVKSESTMKGFLFRIIEVGTKNYSNRTMTMNVDSIVGKYKDIYLENNFSMIVSEMLDIDSKGKIFSSQTNIDDISYNDITNNYGDNFNKPEEKLVEETKEEKTEVEETEEKVEEEVDFEKARQEEAELLENNEEEKTEEVIEEVAEEDEQDDELFQELPEEDNYEEMIEEINNYAVENYSKTETEDVVNQEVEEEVIDEVEEETENNEQSETEEETTEEELVEETEEKTEEVADEQNEILKRLEEQVNELKRQLEEQQRENEELKRMAEEEKAKLNALIAKRNGDNDDDEGRKMKDYVGNLDELEARLEMLKERLKTNEKELRINKKEFIPLSRVKKTLESDKKKLRRREAIVAKRKVLLYGVNNYADIDEEKARELNEELDLLEGLRLSVSHCEEVMEANKDRYPILEHTNKILTEANAQIKSDIAEVEEEIEQAKLRENENNQDNE